jgi:competence ComEA-like helix-hairpin-helix protein
MVAWNGILEFSGCRRGSRQTSSQSGVIPSPPRRARDLLLAFGGVMLALALCLLAGSALAQKKQPPAAPLDLNAASAKELAELPGVGKVTASAIIQFRQKAGPFRRVEDLLAVRGISANKLKAIRPYVFVKSAAPTKPAPAKPVTPAKPSVQGTAKGSAQGAAQGTTQGTGK